MVVENGALPTLAAFLSRFAQDRGFAEIEWIVRATDCARPNQRLQRVLVRKGFKVRRMGAVGDCYYKDNPCRYERRGLTPLHLTAPEPARACPSRSVVS